MNNNNSYSIDPKSITSITYIPNIKSTPKTQYKVNPPIVDNDYTEYTHNKHEPVQAIPTEYIQKVKDYFFYKKSRYSILNKRDYTYFILAINTARRCGDLLNLRISDVINIDGTFKEHIIFDEEKTKIRTYIKMNNNIKEALTLYLNIRKSYKITDYLFLNFKNHKMTVEATRKVMKEVANAIGIPVNIATHSNRKTWAIETIKNNANDSNIELKVSQALGHKSIASTRHYIGSTQQEMDKFFENNAL